MAESGLVQLPNGSSVRNYRTLQYPLGMVQVERWLVSKKLGEGAFGAVYKVTVDEVKATVIPCSIRYPITARTTP